MVQDDEHLWVVPRYIEANPSRAAMVADLADYPWSSSKAHGLGCPDPLLSAMPEWSALGRDAASRRARWREKVAAALPEADLDAVRQSLRGGRPFGRPGWAEGMSRRPAIAGPPRPRGRPRKAGK